MIFPRLVCVSIYDGNTKSLHLAAIGVAEIIKLLQDPDVILVGHNVSFDLGVIIAEAIAQGINEHWILNLVFEAYAANRIVDTMIRSMLVDIAQGKFQEIDGQRRGKVYGLDMLANRWLGKQITQKTFKKSQAHLKTDSWRLHYAYLQNTPITQWPQDASDYAIEDSVVTWDVDAKITSWAITEGQLDGTIPNEFEQHRAAWVLHLIGGWGVRVDEEMVKLVRENLEVQRKTSYAVMDQWGIFKKDRLGNYQLTKKGARQKNIKVLRALIEDGYKQQGETPPLTDGGKDGSKKQTKTDADSARDSGHPAAIEYANGAGAEKLLNTYVPILERGNGGLPVTSSPNVLVASGRTSWTNPNLQNPPRLHGVRECIIPRPGFVLVGADLDTVELRALAQTCLELFGWSEMANAIRRGEDLHLALAGQILGLDYATTKKRYDQGDILIAETRSPTAKNCNFGLGGGMGATKFAITCINNGAPLITDPSAPMSDHIARAKFLKETWFQAWPEMRLFLKHAGDNTGDMGEGVLVQPWSGRVRGGLDYCAYANTYFQGRVADGAKLALWRVSRACYVDKSNCLYGSRIILFLHDELILECPESMAHLCAAELVRLLCGAVQEVIPDVPITSSAVITRRWFKSAKPVYVDGILFPSKPEKDSKGRTVWTVDV
jgi:DNA polymerase I-like protein with 3'-5' exonuclease and polymerase domains